ncbi:hypothetical protein Goshw_018529 [Gossypium schwendimanii]|uniref:Uncharacterized protein n=1 Tax=Gossypium schwendimanii TaxID=34291 RepID=A0A7J9N356_GOSSC|nr:hypothetical protein [Gossypium schwendimanii]
MTTPEYNEWRIRRINDNVPKSSHECTRAEEDLDSLKTDYKKLRLSMKTAGLGKTSEQWRKEIQEEKNKADE